MVMLATGVLCVRVSLGLGRAAAAYDEEDGEGEGEGGSKHGAKGARPETVGQRESVRTLSRGGGAVRMLARAMTARSLSRWLLSGGLVLAAAWCASEAAAQSRRPGHGRAVVLRFEGWSAAQARAAVLEALASEVELVSEEQAVHTAREIGVDVSTPSGMAEVVRHLGITVVVAGSVEGRMRRAETTVMVLDATGNELSRRTGPSPQRRQDRHAIGAIAVEALEEAFAVLERQRTPAPAVVEPEPVERARPPEPERPATSAYRPRQLVLLGGIRVRTVSTQIVGAGTNRHFFAADAYPEIDLELAYRPWFDATSELRGLFLGLQGSFSVGMGYIATAGDTRGMTSLRFRFDVGYAHAIGDMFEIVAGLGLGIEGVQLDNPDGFPSTLFTMLRPAIGGRIRAAGDLLVIELGLGGRIGLDGGPLAGAFGPGLFFGGVDVGLGLSGVVEPGFSWAARVGYLHHALSFSGAGGSFGAGTGGIDEAVEGRFLLGWSI